MKTLRKIIIYMVTLAAILFLAVYFFYYTSGDPVALSKSQAELVESLGRPEQFAITYMPKGSEKGSEFIRQEIWFYPNTKTRLTFLAGELVSTDTLDIPDNTEYLASPYKSEDFNFYTTLDEARGLMGDYPLEPLEMPGFFDDGVEVYGSAGAMFVFEDGYMTYMETLD